MSFFKKLFFGSESPKKTPAMQPEKNTEETIQISAEAGLTISLNDVFTKQHAANKEDAIRFIAAKMLENGYVSEDYAEALLAREEQVSTFLTNGIAIPHGVKESKHLVKKTGFIIAQFPDGVEWKGCEQIVHLAIGIAANGQEHLEALTKITPVVMDVSLSEKMGSTASAEEIIEALQLEVRKTDNSQKNLSSQAEATVVDEAGMHARPATKLAQLAGSYKNTNIRLGLGEKTIDMKSMVSILSLGIQYQSRVIVSAEGENADEAVKAIAVAINAGLDCDDESNANATYNPLEGLGALSHLHGKHVYTGAAASPGIAVAKVFVFKEEALHLEKNATNLTEEIQALDKALATAMLQLDELYANMLRKSPNEAAIFKAHQQLIADDSIVNTAKDIINQGHKAAWSWDRTLKDQIAALEALDDERIKARAADMYDVAMRVARILENKNDDFSFPKDEDFILLASELTPSQTAFLGNAPIKAIVTELGGPNSHMAILARALGIPALVGIGIGPVDSVQTGELSVVDPQSSRFVVDPDAETLAEGKERIEAWKAIQKVENAQKFEEAITLDGHKVDVVCNIAKPADASSVLDNGGEGVGLLRTEFMFEASSVEPSIEEQFVALKSIVETLGDKILIVRTADIGGDKPVSWLDMPKEENPFLGVRGIRLSLRNEEMLRNQLSAIYKTAIWQQGQDIKSGIHIMFPMIAKLSEWDKAKAIAEDVREKIGAPYLPLGIMIEVPSAALLADHFAKEVDFFSVGSNDMTQYTLAMDRLHPQLAMDADSYTPALLRLIDMTVKAAKTNGKWVGVCGNMAADPDMAAILVGLGVTELSVSPANVPAVKLLIRSVSYARLKEKAQKALTLGRSADVRRLYENRDDLA